MRPVLASWARRAALLVPFALLVIALRKLDLSRVATELAHVRSVWVFLALAFYVSILPLWALQWWLLSPSDSRPRVRTMLGIVAMTSSILNTTPLLVGEATGVVLLVSRAGLSRAAALAVLAMDQLLVGIAKVAVLAGAAATNVLPAWMQRGRSALMIGVALLLFALAGAALYVESLAPLRSVRRGGGALLLALAKKAAEACAIACVARAFGVSLGAGSTLLVLAALNLATLVPVVPGNIGVYEAAATLAYAWLGVTPERALGVAIVQHACYFVALALPGYRWLAGAALASKPAAAP